jgi:pyruvate ferredoxin oxidoreductase beta subunit
MFDDGKKKTNSIDEINKRSCDLSEFQEKIMNPYLKGKAENDVPADELAARSLLPPSTARQRSFAAVASEVPRYFSDRCVACMECVISCPDAAIRARVNTEQEVKDALGKVPDSAVQDNVKAKFVKTTKFWNTYEKKQQTPGMFSIWIDPDKCKGCGECAQVCSEHQALLMEPKDEKDMQLARQATSFANDILPVTRSGFINERLVSDLFLMEDSWIYKGGSGACKGCGEVTALKMAMMATTSKYGKNMSIVAATGCNSVFSSTYPYNIFDVPWTNPLFENAPATALGVRMRLNQTEKRDTKVWVFGGDGAMNDIGFQSLSRALMSGEDINVLVLDTQSYSNTGGQASTATFLGQNAKMSARGRSSLGKSERRKELSLLSLMHPDVFVAQVSPAYYNHFLRSVLSALEYSGPSVIVAYAPCMPEHGIADNVAFEQAKAAVISRTFPLLVHDPRKGATLKERLDLKGNPALSESWYKDPKTAEVCDFIWFAKKEERFSHLFGSDGSPSEVLMRAQEDRAKNWSFLCELAGLKQ